MSKAAGVNEHIITLYIALCYMADGRTRYNVWKSQKHSDGSTEEGWFILGIGTDPGEQITYHIPITRWTECAFARTLEQAPEYDGHTSNDVLNRIKNL